MKRDLIDDYGRIVRCSCGGLVLYDQDSCGHEWLDCADCKESLETYQSDCCFEDWYKHTGQVNLQTVDNKV